MKLVRDNFSPTLLLVILLPVLLGILAGLQYRWLGEISTAERERLQSRLNADVKRFSQEFNGEITKAFFTFQLDSRILENPELLVRRYDLWKRQALFPQLIGEIYQAQIDEQGNYRFLRLNLSAKQFEKAELTNELAFLQEKLSAKPHERKLISPDSVAEKIPALIIPVLQISEETRLSEENSREEIIFTGQAAPLPSHSFVILKLDAEALKTQILPELARRNFSNDGSAAYNISVVDKSEPHKIIYQSQANQTAENIAQSDATAGMFELAPESSNILILDSSFPKQPEKVAEQIWVRREIEERRLKIKELPPAVLKESGNLHFQFARRQSGKGETFVRKPEETSGRWLLSVQHADGSLENFVNKIRWRNLGISFGILALLGASVGLLLLSTHRAKRLAQRQIDFVSSVSHEFRTPVAVICSAGENLADGIVQNPAQVEKYGKLVRREGQRISEMVEQILEFAGARARRKQFEFQPTEIEKVIETALADCQSLVEEKGFTIEKQIEPGLPVALADSNALRHSLQNLVSNAIKYSNGSRLVEVAAKSDKKTIKISVADKGIGIDAKELKHIFEPFYRGKEAVSAQIHGNGLGLSLVKQTVEAHNGKIRVESEKGKGSRFTIEIPAGNKT